MSKKFISEDDDPQDMDLTNEEYTYILWLRSLPEDEREKEMDRMRALARKRMH
jgi:hypothetical protein